MSEPPAEPDDYRARVAAAGERLTPAERLVASVLLADPQAVGFGTVAELAGRADVGVGTVARLAARLGYGGFSDLQRAVRRDLARQLRPAAERIHEPGPEADGAGDDPLRTAVVDHAELELENVRATLSAADPATLGHVVDRLADLGRPVAVLSGDASAGVARHLVDELAALRPNVVAVEGNEVATARAVALLPADATVVVIDLRRYDRWVVDTARSAAHRGATVVALTDSELSPLAALARHTFVVAAAALGPFDSHVGTLALVHLLVALASRQLSPTAAARLDQIERAWQERTSLVEE